MRSILLAVMVVLAAIPAYAQLTSPKVNGSVVMQGTALQSSKLNGYVVIKSCLGVPKINGYVIMKNAMLRLLNEFTITSAAAQWWPKWGPQAGGGGPTTPTCRASGS